MHVTRCLVVGMLAAAFGSRVAAANEVTFAFEGIVSQAFTSKVNVGEPVSGYMSFDSLATDHVADSSEGFYDLDRFHVSIGGIVVDQDRTRDQLVFSDITIVTGSGTNTFRAESSPSFDFYSLSLDFQFAPFHFPSDALLTEPTLLNVGRLEGGNELIVGLPDDSSYFKANIGELRLPEPRLPGLAFLGVGLWAVGCRLRRRLPV